MTESQTAEVRGMLGTGQARVHAIVLGLVLIGSLVLKLPHLGHKSLKPLDESFHAIVAENFLKHPFTPTLDDGPHLDVDVSDWQNAHIWLHKPPMAMWQIAISYAVLGVNTLALRLPSAILATLAAGLTYLIGRELIGAAAALIATAFQAFNPVIAMLVHGYVFSDHVDIALLFWVEVAIWFLLRAVRTARRRNLILCGAAQGLGLLSKSYPALIVTELAFFVWVVGCLASRKQYAADVPEQAGTGPSPTPHVWPARRFGSLDLGIIVLSTLLTVLPWVAICLVRWPELFAYENIHALTHLTRDVEGWAAPWDRLVFDYWIRIFHVYYPLVLVSGIVVAIRAVRLADWRLMFLIAWALGVLVPHLAATSKTMTATLIGWPAMWLMCGYLISQAMRGCGMSAGAWATAAILPLLLQAGDIPASGWGYSSNPGFAAIMRQHLWVVWYLIAAMGAGMIVAMLRRHWLYQAMVWLAWAATLVLALRWWGGDSPRGYAYLGWRVTQIAKDKPNFRAIGQFARHLPQSAVFLVEETDKLDNKLIQFAADRTCYAVRPDQWEAMGSKLIDAGGIPYLVASREIALPVAFVDQDENRTVYACSPAAHRAAQHPAEELPGSSGTRQ